MCALYVKMNALISHGCRQDSAASLCLLLGKAALELHTPSVYVQCTQARAAERSNKSSSCGVAHHSCWDRLPPWVTMCIHSAQYGHDLQSSGRIAGNKEVLLKIQYNVSLM